MSVSVTAELIDVVPTTNTLGEGVLWDPVDAAVYWTDIEESQFFRYVPATRHMADWRTPERLCAFARCQDNARLLCAFESGFGFWHPGSTSIEWIARLATYPDVRLNDGRTDRQGRFWCGSLHEATISEQQRAAGTLFSLDASGQLQTHRDAVRISNSVTTSPDGRWLYFTDTPTQQIDRYPLDVETGRLGLGEVFARTDPGCYPDGSVTDALGFLWNAQWGGHQVVRYAEDGAVDFCLSVPAKQPTCVAFGGTNNRLLFVTTARAELDATEVAASEAGSLLVYSTNVDGLSDTPYRVTP
ncbi:MAG: SMP-30/gluconolactonase/LRE family protein [Pseudomonadota bacterium]